MIIIPKTPPYNQYARRDPKDAGSAKCAPRHPGPEPPPGPVPKISRIHI